ncbi:hypothetical protein QT631_22530, partial [Xanthomonas citri pv. citri]
KYAAALTIQPDKHEALNNWGSLLSEQAKQAGGEEASRLFALASEKLMAALERDPSQTYNLACLAALRDDEVKCRDNLEIAKRCGTLPSREHLLGDKDLEQMREKQWFQDLFTK